MLRKIKSAVLVLIMLGAITAPAMAATPQDNSDVHITKMIIEPKGPDMNFTLYYESSFFTRVFSVIFGAKVVQPSIEHMFTNFTNVSIVSIDSNSGIADVTVKAISRPASDGWYVYDGNTTFTSSVDVIEVHNPDGKIVTMNNSSELPAISNREPTLNDTA